MRKVAQVGLDGVRRTDWHDYEVMRRDAARMGASTLFVHAVVLLRHVAVNICSVSAQHTQIHTQTYTHTAAPQLNFFVFS